MALYFHHGAKRASTFLAPDGSLGLGSLAAQLGLEPLGVTVGPFTLNFNSSTQQSPAFAVLLTNLRAAVGDEQLGSAERPIKLEGRPAGAAGGGTSSAAGPTLQAGLTGSSAVGASVPQVSARTFHGTPSEGLNALPQHMWVMRQSTCLVILIRAAVFGFQLLRSPPHSGKTSLLQLLKHVVDTKGIEGYAQAVYLNMARMGDMNFPDFFFDETRRISGTGCSWSDWIRRSDGGAPPNHGQSPLNLLLLDEMQLTYSRPAQIDRLVEYMKDTAGIGHGVTRIIMASVHGDSPSLGTSSQTSSSSTTTPFNYGPEHLVQLLQNHSAVPLSDEALLELAVATSQAANRGDIAAKQQLSDKLGQQAPSVGFTAVETSDLWARHWDGQPAGSWFAMSDPSVQEHLWRVTAGQAGPMSAILRRLQELLHDSTRGQAAVGAGDKAYLQLFRTGDIYNVLRAQRGFLRKQGLLLGSPTMDLFNRVLEEDPVMGCELESLTAQQLATALDTKKTGVLFVTDSKVAFWSPLHYMYYRNLVSSQRLTSLGAANRPQGLTDFLKHCVRRMSARQLRDTLSRRKEDSALLERGLQMEFYRTAFDSVPMDCQVDADVNWSPGQGLVDFWVRPVDWAIELLCDGRGLKEHERRFLPGGRYSLWEFEQYALLDFRSEGGPIPIKPRDTNCYHVLFEPQYEYASCVDAANYMHKLWRVKLLGDSKDAEKDRLDAARLMNA